MSQDGLVPISLDGVVALFTCLAIVIGVVLWREHKRKVRRREEYLAQFNSTHLRMSRYKIGLVYRVVAEADDEVTVVAVWDQGRAVVAEGEAVLPAETLIAYYKNRFGRTQFRARLAKLPLSFRYGVKHEQIKACAV